MTVPVHTTPESKRGKLAASYRHHPDDPHTTALAADYKTDKAEAYIRRVLEQAPPLSEAQRSRLADLLTGARS